MNFVFLVLAFLLLVFSRQILINLLAEFVGSQSLRTICFLLFFPGVIIHEFSHFMVANLLLVPTGEISLFPEKEKMASIQVAKTDPFRQALIGLAPTVIGTAIILAIFHFMEIKNLLTLYLVFAINNTMFSSESDRKSWLGLFALFFLIGAAFYLFGIFNLLVNSLWVYIKLAANLIATAYAFTFLVNLIFIFPLFVLQKIRGI